MKPLELTKFKKLKESDKEVVSVLTNIINNFMWNISYKINLRFKIKIESFLACFKNSLKMGI